MILPSDPFISALWEAQSRRRHVRGERQNEYGRLYVQSTHECTEFDVLPSRSIVAARTCTRRQAMLFAGDILSCECMSNAQKNEED